MRLDRTILSLVLTPLVMLGAWACLIVCTRFASKTRQHFRLKQLRREGRTVPYEQLNNESGAVLYVKSAFFQGGIEYWWVPTNGQLSSEAVIDKWNAGEAFAFERQCQIARLVLSNSVPMQVVRYQEVSRFNT